jgi:hypothetical protein
MADPADSNLLLATALTNLTAVIQGLQGGGGGGGAAAAPAPLAPILDPFASPAPFDLSSRAGSHAFASASAALDFVWDGSTAGFPPFVSALRDRASECRWDATAPQGILTFAVGTPAVDKDLLAQHYAVTEAQTEAARIARTNDRAMQNAQAMYQCIKKSIDGDIKAMLFDQTGNMPSHQDGPCLFKLLTSFTIAASLQLSIMSFNQIVTFDPASCKFNIPQMNTKLTNLFMLATTNDRVLSAAEKIQHTLTAYSRIKQPEQWAQWVRAKVDQFDDGTLNNCQTFMNSAALKYVKISAEHAGSFQGRSTTLQDDIVAMVAASTKRKAASVADKVPTKRSSAPPDKTSFPPFVTHYKDPSGKAYKVGDTKEWNGVEYHFCDTPNHRHRHKWHPHSAGDCRTRKSWIDRGRPPIVRANVGDAADDDTALTELTGASGDASSIGGSAGAGDSTAGDDGASARSTATGAAAAVSDVTVLLATALSVAPSDHARALIADALNSLQDM